MVVKVTDYRLPRPQVSQSTYSLLQQHAGFQWACRGEVQIKASVLTHSLQQQEQVPLRAPLNWLLRLCLPAGARSDDHVSAGAMRGQPGVCCFSHATQSCSALLTNLIGPILSVPSFRRETLKTEAAR